MPLFIVMLINYERDTDLCDYTGNVYEHVSSHSAINYPYLSPSRATLSVIDRKAERRLLASKDSWRKPLCCFEVLIDAIIVRIREKSSAAANLLWFIFQEE